MEVYSAHHPETVDELLEWPWRRFERFYDSFMRRKLAESLEERKNNMIGALWSNSNYDGDGKGESPRIGAIREIEDQYDSAVRRVLDRDWDAKQAREDEEFENNPFFAAMRRGTAKLEDVESVSADTQVGHVVAPAEMDQA